MRAFKWIPRGSDKLSMDIFFSSSRFRVKIKLQTHDYHTNDFFYHHHMQPIAFGRVTKLNKCQGVNLELFSQRLQEYWSSRLKWDLLCEGWSTSYATTPAAEKDLSVHTFVDIFSFVPEYPWILSHFVELYRCHWKGSLSSTNMSHFYSSVFTQRQIFQQWPANP